MSHSKTGNGIGQLVKLLLTTFFRLLAMIAAFAFKIAGLILTKIAESLQKLSDHGHH